VAFIAMLFVPTGCTISKPVDPPKVKPSFVYRVGAGDVLNVEVFDETKLVRQITVSPDGTLILPLAGNIQVTDKTLPEVAELVVLGLIKSERFVDPKLLNVTVSLLQSRSAQVTIFGEVGRQGQVPYRDRMSVVDVIAESGGPSWQTAKMEDVKIVRGRLDDPLVMALDLENVMLAADKDIFLQPGDMVVVPPKYVTVMSRYVQQLLSPINSLMGTASQATITSSTFAR